MHRFIARIVWYVGLQWFLYYTIITLQLNTFNVVWSCPSRVVRSSKYYRPEGQLVYKVIGLKSMHSFICRIVWYIVLNHSTVKCCQCSVILSLCPVGSWKYYWLRGQLVYLSSCTVLFAEYFDAYNLLPSFLTLPFTNCVKFNFEKGRPGPNPAPLKCRTKLNKVRLWSHFKATLEQRLIQTAYLRRTLRDTVSFRTALAWTLVFSLWKEFTPTWNQTCF